MGSRQRRANQRQTRSAVQSYTRWLRRNRFAAVAALSLAAATSSRVRLPTSRSSSRPLPPGRGEKRRQPTRQADGVSAVALGLLRQRTRARLPGASRFRIRGKRNGTTAIRTAVADLAARARCRRVARMEPSVGHAIVATRSDSDAGLLAPLGDGRSANSAPLEGKRNPGRDRTVPVAGAANRRRELAPPSRHPATGTYRSTIALPHP